jgi:hypothetical protein
VNWVAIELYSFATDAPFLRRPQSQWASSPCRRGRAAQRGTGDLHRTAPWRSRALRHLPTTSTTLPGIGLRAGLPPPGCRASTGGGAGTAAGELDPRRRRRLGRGEALALGGEASSGSLNEDGDGRYSPIVWVVAESAPFLHRYRSEQKMDHRYEASVGG